MTRFHSDISKATLQAQVIELTNKVPASINSADVYTVRAWVELIKKSKKLAASRNVTESQLISYPEW